MGDALYRDGEDIQNGSSRTTKFFKTAHNKLYSSRNGSEVPKRCPGSRGRGEGVVFESDYQFPFGLPRI